MSTTYIKTRDEQTLKDWAAGLGPLPPANKRVQVKMPELVLKKLDELYPNIDRSKVITQLALQAIVTQLQFIDRPDVGELADSEQSELNDMWDYLEKRDAGL